MSNKKGIGLFALIAIVVSSSIGSGIFDMSRDLANAAHPGPALIAWVIVGLGILALSLSMSNLVIRRPELEGIFVYAEEGFGKYAGFISGWGYWLAAWLGNVAFATILMSAIGYFYPPLESGQSVLAILLASVVSWALTYIVIQGVESASVVNAVVMVCKLIPLFTFIVVSVILFKGHLFTSDFWGNVQDNVNNGIGGSILDQIQNCIIVMVWVFVGIEGAAMLSSRARVKSDAAKATIVGVSILLVVYILASMLPYGYFSQEELAEINSPALVYIFKDMVGEWGGTFISLGLIISILGAWISWTLLPGETIFLMTKRDLLPRSWGKLNSKNSPAFALILTNVFVQIFLVTLLFTSEAYNMAYSLCTVAIMISYMFVGLYQMKYSYQNISDEGNTKQFIFGLVAFLFQFFAVILAGINFLLLVLIAYVPGIFFYIKAQKESGREERLTSSEMIWTIIIVGGALVSVAMLAMGNLSF